jgi:hypothetical protein
MKGKTVFITIFFAAALSMAALGIGAAVDSPRTLMSPSDYMAGKRAIEAEIRLALARCREVPASQRDICKAEARGEERVRKAELSARYHGTVSSLDEVRLARAKALYDVARARCGGRLGEERIDCLRAAREDRNKSLADARLAST